MLSSLSSWRKKLVPPSPRYLSVIFFLAAVVCKWDRIVKYDKAYKESYAWGGRRKRILYGGLREFIKYRNLFMKSGRGDYGSASSDLL